VPCFALVRPDPSREVEARLDGVQDWDPLWSEPKDESRAEDRHYSEQESDLIPRPERPSRVPRSGKRFDSSEDFGLEASELAFGDGSAPIFAVIGLRGGDGG
jgi:hypothetical protein